MNIRTDTERILDAFLAPEADRLPDRVIDAALSDIDRTPQRRALRVPWRFPHMPAFSRATGIAAVALVAVVGAGGLLYLNSKAPGGPGSQATASPAPPTAPPTMAPTAAPTTRVEVAPGIYGWKTYTSPVYGYTISYPDDWTVADRATEPWQPGQAEGTPNIDVFFNNGSDTKDMVVHTLQLAAPSGADLDSWEGLLAALTETCGTPTDTELGTCPGQTVATPMCLGSPGCTPVAFLHSGADLPRAIFGDPETGTLTYFLVGRVDDFPAAERYGGTAALLKAMLGELGVREPRPGEISE